MGVRAVAAFLTGWKRWVALAAAAGVAGVVLAQGAVAQSKAAVVRFGGDKAATRIVLDIAQSVQARVVSGGDGGKELVVDFPRLDVADGSGRGQGLVGAYDLSRTAGGARLKLSLNDGAVIDRRFLLAPGDGVGHYRYVIDLKSAAAPKDAAGAPARPAPAPAVIPERTPVRRVIVVDAGHGGHDPGALGGGAKEKDVTLAAARALKQELEATGRYRVVMTRDADTYVPLENRVQIARRAGADLFISLHADAGHNKETRGASVYTLSDEGSDKVARNFASNSNWFIEADMPGGTRAVQQILFDLTQRATRNRSGAFAEMLIEEVGREAPLLTRAHRDAKYVVLFAPDVPAVLLEMGFITNGADEKLLTDEKHRTRMAKAIAGAIDNYFRSSVQIAAR